MSTKLTAALPALEKRIERLRTSSHDRLWRKHPAVKTDDELTFGQRAADVMKGAFSTWTALGGILLFMAVWIRTGGFGHDGFPFILLNLCLSCLAALQCFILLIAAKRADQIASAVAMHTLENTTDIKTLIQQNTDLTEQVERLTRAVHDHITQEQTTQILAAVQPLPPADTQPAAPKATPPVRKRTQTKVKKETA